MHPILGKVIMGNSDWLPQGQYAKKGAGGLLDVLGAQGMAKGGQGMVASEL